MKQPTIFHVVPRRNLADEATISRCIKAFDSWNWLYRTANVEPKHVWKVKRNAQSIGSDRDLPFLKDVLKVGMDACVDPFDVVFFTNDDVIVHPLSIAEIKRHLQFYQAGSMRRVDIDTRDGRPPMPPLYMPPIYFIERGWPHLGRDGFVFNAGWLKQHWQRIPDFIIGAWGWDVWLASFIRLMRGHSNLTCSSLYDSYHDCELPDGLIIHEAHTSKWTEGDDWQNKPANKHNRKLFDESQKVLFPKLVMDKVDKHDWPRAALIRYPHYMEWCKYTVETIAKEI